MLPYNLILTLFIIIFSFSILEIMTVILFYYNTFYYKIKIHLLFLCYLFYFIFFEGHSLMVN